MINFKGLSAMMVAALALAVPAVAWAQPPSAPCRMDAAPVTLANVSDLLACVAKEMSPELKDVTEATGSPSSAPGGSINFKSFGQFGGSTLGGPSKTLGSSIFKSSGSSGAGSPSGSGSSGSGN
jgi:hypothetical protein